MNHLNKYIGNKGESLAEGYLENHDYKILEKNFTCKIGEIDIIAKNDEYISFVEVKTRRSLQFGLPAEAVTYNKQQKIYRSAQMYILKNKLYNSSFRFDVIEIILNSNNSCISINLIKNAFQI